MKIILEFDTEKDEEFQLHKTYIKAEDMSLALWDITQLLRSEVKHAPDSMSEETYNKLESLREDIHSIINKYDLDNIVNG